MAKQVDPAIFTVGGGSHFGALGVESLRRIPELDYVIEGEAELAFAALLEALEQKITRAPIPRVCYRHEGEIKKKRTLSKSNKDMLLILKINNIHNF